MWYFYHRVLEDILQTHTSEPKNKDGAVDWREPHDRNEYSLTDMVSSVSIVTVPQAVRSTNHLPNIDGFWLEFQERSFKLHPFTAQFNLMYRVKREIHNSVPRN
jgi:hypothetical protein